MSVKNTNILIGRYQDEKKVLRQELQDLLLATPYLNDEEKELLMDFGKVFTWDVSFSVECDFRPFATSTSGTYEPETLEEFHSYERGHDLTDSVSLHELQDVYMEDFDEGQVTVTEKQLRVRNFCMKPEVEELLGRSIFEVGDKNWFSHWEGFFPP